MPRDTGGGGGGSHSSTSYAAYDGTFCGDGQAEGEEWRGGGGAAIGRNFYR